MRHILFLALLLLGIDTAFSQEDPKYFPQETIVISGCENSDYQSACLYNFLKGEVLTFLKDPKKTKQLLNYEKDTLTLGATLVFKDNNSLDDKKSGALIRDKALREKYEKKFEGIFKDLDITSIDYRKPKPLYSQHTLSFQFLVKKEDKSIDFEYLENETPYTGGVIQEIPRFPGCEAMPEDEARTCFQLKIQDHIRQHFRYPEEAMKKGIAGTVAIIFVITPEGTVDGIRMRGNPILQEEAKRIISLLPTMVPGKKNGEPVKVPYSIPMYFRLN